MPVLGSQDIGTSVDGIMVDGPLAFLATSKSGKQLQIWNIANLAAISLAQTYNAGTLVSPGMDYEPDRVYLASTASPNFQIITSH